MQGPEVMVTMRDCRSFQNEASGLWVVAGGHVSAVNCHFADNHCNGGACWDAGTHLTAHACTFQNNAANGVRYLYGSGGALSACLMAGNHEQGLEAGEPSTRVRVTDCCVTGAS
jgi:hypothetical protein